MFDVDIGALCNLVLPLCSFGLERLGWDGMAPCFLTFLALTMGVDGWRRCIQTCLFVWTVDRLKVNAYCSMVFTRFGFEVVMIGSRR